MPIDEDPEDRLAWSCIAMLLVIALLALIGVGIVLGALLW